CRWPRTWTTPPSSSTACSAAMPPTTSTRSRRWRTSCARRPRKATSAKSPTAKARTSLGPHAPPLVRLQIAPRPFVVRGFRGPCPEFVGVAVLDEGVHELVDDDVVEDVFGDVGKTV